MKIASKSRLSIVLAAYIVKIGPNTATSWLLASAKATTDLASHRLEQMRKSANREEPDFKRVLEAARRISVVALPETGNGFQIVIQARVQLAEQTPSLGGLRIFLYLA